MPLDYKPWTSQKGIKLQGVPPTARSYDILDVAYADRLQQHPNMPLKPHDHRPPPEARPNKTQWVNPKTYIFRCFRFVHFGVVKMYTKTEIIKFVFLVFLRIYLI